MSRSILAAAALVGVAAAFVIAIRAPSRRAAVIRPGSLRGANVLLVTIDTLRADHLGAYGGKPDVSPTIDRLARGGIRFDRAFTTAPMTLPAHASILTGLTPVHHGVRTNGIFRLAAEHPTLATALKAAGYRTGAFVGAFVLDARFGLGRGFDVYDDGYPHGQASSDFRFSERPAEQVTKAAEGWILQNSTGPWFAWAHLFDPHAPYQPPAAFASGRDAYDGEIAYADAALGRLLESLRRAGLLDRTLIVITADHGESLGEHGEKTHGLFAYNATLRVPLIIAAPGVEPAVSTRVVSHADLLPTVLWLLGVDAPPELDGTSVLGAGEDSHRAVYFEALDANVTRGWAPLTGVVSDGMKFIDLPVAELYNLDADPNELRNLASEREPEVRRLQTVLAVSKRSPAARNRIPVDSEAAARLQALGYVGSAVFSPKTSFTDSDDPKRLVTLNETFNAALDDYSEGRAAEAIDALRQVVAVRPDFVTARTTLASMLIAQQRASDALALLRQAPDPSSPDVLRKLGAALLVTGDARGACRALEEASRAAHVDPDVFNALGVAYARVGRVDEARRALQRLLAIDPNAAGTWNNLGLVEMQDHRSRAAADAFRHAVDADPSYGDAWEGLGAALVSDDPNAAAAAWKRAVALQPRNFDLLFNLAMLLADSETPQEARPYLERFLRDAPPDRYAADFPRVRSAIAAVARGQKARE